MVNTCRWRESSDSQRKHELQLISQEFERGHLYDIEKTALTGYPSAEGYFGATPTHQLLGYSTTLPAEPALDKEKAAPTGYSSAEESLERY